MKVNSTFALRNVLESEAGFTLAKSEKKIPPKEAAHRLRIAQGLNPDLKRHEQKKTFDGRWFFQASILSVSLWQLDLLVSNLVSTLEE